MSNTLDSNLPVLLVDTSFWLYYRFFALRKWYCRAYPDTQKVANFNLEHNWLEDKIFMDKYIKLFLENIKKICKIIKTNLTNVVFCIDCPHKEIWRCQHTDDYKSTRLESHRKQSFNSFNIFSYIKNTILPILQTKHNIKIISCSRCEADDIIGNFAPYLVNKGYGNIFILANDNDYLQICNDKIFLMNGLGKIISNVIEIENKFIGEKYLISKILIGDKSDNIKCCSMDIGFIENNICKNIYKNVSKELVYKIINDNAKYNVFTNMLSDIRTRANTINNIIYGEKFKHNALLMDFQMLPNELKTELETKFQILVNL